MSTPQMPRPRDRRGPLIGPQGRALGRKDIPGLVALRSYRRWRDGAILQPSAAWVVAVLGIWIAILVPLAMYTDFVGLTIALAVVGPLASVAYVLRG